MKDPYYTPHELNPRREAPNRAELGDKKYKQRISRSKDADLPFKFSKPPKRTAPRRDMYIICGTCEKVHAVHVYIAGFVCTGCNSYKSVSEETKLTSEQVSDYFENK